jgi:3-ketoacyl-CoA synthase
MLPLWPLHPVYLIDINCFKPSEELRVDKLEVDRIWEDKETGMYNEDDMAFTARVFERSGLGYNNTFLPKSIHPKYCGCKPITDLSAAEEECTETVLGTIL